MRKLLRRLHDAMFGSTDEWIASAMHQYHDAQRIQEMLHWYETQQAKTHYVETYRPVERTDEEREAAISAALKEAARYVPGESEGFRKYGTYTP